MTYTQTFGIYNSLVPENVFVLSKFYSNQENE